MAGRTINGQAVCSGRAISTATTTLVKSGSGYLHTLSVTGGTAGTIRVYDSLVGSGAFIADFGSTNGLMTYTLDVDFAIGLTIVTSAATLVTVSFI